VPQPSGPPPPALTVRLQLEVLAATGRLRPHLPPTPLIRSASLSRECGSDVFLKLENLQPTGSFKVRGALNRLLCLAPGERGRGVVAASSGNHGLGLAYAGRLLGVAVEVFVPETTPSEKRAAIAAAGARVAVYGADCVDAETKARAVAVASGRVYVSPYNDLQVAAGQGTIAVELLANLHEMTAVYVALGGGGLVSGIAAHLRAAAPGTEVVAVSPMASPAMAECVRAGRIVDVPCGPTLSDSTAGNVEPGAITFELCRDLIDRHVLVEEAAIGHTLVRLLAEDHLLAEGAAALAVAGLLQDQQRRKGPLAVVLCGANLPLSMLLQVLAQYAAP
jgi:threonine dehydratase